MEKLIKPVSGFLALIIGLVAMGLAIYLFANVVEQPAYVIPAILLALTFFVIVKGLVIIQPNHSSVLTFFGKYVGTIKSNGLFFVNPLYTGRRVSLRSDNLQGQTLKVNDKMGNPIEIAAVIVWQVGDTYRAIFDVENYEVYVRNQSEAAVRHLAGSFSYDSFEDDNANITLREGGDRVNEILEKELTDRLSPAGIIIKEARISHLAYAQEIAGAMLQRQQATAIVAAREKIVEGAVGMVEMALSTLSQKGIIDLDDDKKATMVSNLMVVLCGEKAASPVINTGTLYQ